MIERVYRREVPYSQTVVLSQYFDLEHLEYVLFFLHDGRTSDVREAIRAHQSCSVFAGNASEANGVIGNFTGSPLELNTDFSRL